MKRFFTNRYTLYGLGIIFVIVIWTITSLIIANPVKIFPDPIRTIQQVGISLSSSYVYKCLGMTFLRMIIGFAIAFILALIIGTIAGDNQKLQDFLKPLIVTLKSIPTAAVVFIILVLIGVNGTPIIMVSLISFPILYESIIGGFNNIDETIQDSLKVDGSKGLKRIINVKLPLSISYILVGIASSFALSFKISIMSEIIAGGDGYGLGNAIKAARVDDPSNMVPIFAYSFIAVFVILLIDLICFIIKSKYKKEN